MSCTRNAKIDTKDSGEMLEDSIDKTMSRDDTPNFFYKWSITTFVKPKRDHFRMGAMLPTPFPGSAVVTRSVGHPVMDRGQNPQDPWPSLSTPLDKEPIEIFEANEIDVPAKQLRVMFLGDNKWIPLSIGGKSGLSVMNHNTLVI